MNPRNAWPAVILALGAMAIVATMAVMGVATGTIELVTGVLVTPVILALVAQQVGETRGTLGAVQQQTNGTQAAMVQAQRETSAALTQIVHHITTGQPAPLTTEQQQPAATPPQAG